MDVRIKQADSAADLAEVRRLFRAYAAFLGVDLGIQGFEEELAGLPGRYAPPDGALLIARRGEVVVGCVGLRRLADGVCEMKRLFVTPEGRGGGLGRRLAEAVIAIARERGYERMRLDTLDRLEAAMRLYESLGFRRTAPYYDNPLPGVVYWELPLAGGGR